MENIYLYLEQNSDECQFSLSDLMIQIEGEYSPDAKTVKAKLLQKYAENILIAVTVNKSQVICFRNTGYKLLTDTWCNNKQSDPKEERLRIARAAASIVLDDVRSQVYETNQYPPSDNFLQDVNTVIPKTLHTFFWKLF
ncbi:hypothetical protein PR048_018320 [Dryococelus australis]|uniref:Uncharacterized protein n=1 Tax=Dryococelus australis TaxID=614101 RepID=A0ABQ9HC38_9NEOP|nr:hypothetical protein PR048_018320 [Dryococelus australis]